MKTKAFAAWRSKVEKDTTAVSVSGGMMDFCLEDLMDWTAVEEEILAT
jgi:hypothetical protein